MNSKAAWNRQMDVAALLGLLASVGALMINWQFASHWSRELVGLPVLMVVIVGSVGAAVAGSNGRTLASIPKVLGRIWCTTRPVDPASLIRLMVALARLVRSEGLLSLERLLPDIANKFLKRGIELVIDGRSSEVIREIMEAEMFASYQRLIAVANFFNTIGCLAPSFGAVATVSSLTVNLPGTDEPAKVGSVVAISLWGVMYGLVLRSLVCIPIGVKLSAAAEEELITNTMLVEGILSLSASENPRTLEERMSAFLRSDDSVECPLSQHQFAKAHARCGLFQRRLS